MNDLLINCSLFDKKTRLNNFFVLYPIVKRNKDKDMKLNGMKTKKLHLDQKTQKKYHTVIQQGGSRGGWLQVPESSHICRPDVESVASFLV